MDRNAWIGSTPSLIGYAGASIVVAAYFLNQRRLLKSQDWRFPALNLAGSLLVMMSLYFQPNPPSVIIEIFWSSISLYGIRENLRLARVQAPSVNEPRSPPT